MELLCKALKIGALVLLIVVLAIVFAPTPKGAFLIIHFTTTLQAWFTVQLLFLGLAVAAHRLLFRLSLTVRVSAENSPPLRSHFASLIEPLRC